MQRTAQAIAAAIQAEKAVVIKESESDRDLLPNDCHANAKKFAERRGGKVVRGWLIRQADLYITHSIVKLADALYEVTPGVGVPYTFVAASDAPDGVWSEGKEWSTIILLPEDPSAWLAG